MGEYFSHTIEFIQMFNFPYFNYSVNALTHFYRYITIYCCNRQIQGLLEKKIVLYGSVTSRAGGYLTCTEGSPFLTCTERSLYGWVSIPRNSWKCIRSWLPNVQSLLGNSVPKLPCSVYTNLITVTFIATV